MLVVDDEPLIAETLAEILRTAGYAVSVAYNGETASEMAEIAPPELLVTDICMPGMNGVQLAIELCRSIPDCQVLLFTGYPGNDALAAAEKAGHHFTVLEKPLSPRSVLSELGTLRNGTPSVDRTEGVHVITR